MKGKVMEGLAMQPIQELGLLKLDSLDIRKPGEGMKGHVAWDVSGAKIRRVFAHQVRGGKFGRLVFIPRWNKGRRITNREMLFLAKVYSKWGDYMVSKPEYADSLLAMHRSANKARATWSMPPILGAAALTPVLPTMFIVGLNGFQYLLPVYGTVFLACLGLGGVLTYFTEVLPAHWRMDGSGIESVFTYSPRLDWHPDFNEFGDWLESKWSSLTPEFRAKLQLESPTPSMVAQYLERKKLPAGKPRRKITAKAGATPKAIPQVKAGSWNSHLLALTTVKKEWANWEMDILKVVQYPALFDMRESATVNLHRELMYAESVKPQSGEAYSPSHPFVKSVAGLKLAWKVAKSEAERIAQSNFGAEERVRLSRALDLLRIALNVSGTPAERQSSYQRAMKQLEGLVKVPVAAKVAIESGVRLNILEKAA